MIQSLTALKVRMKGIENTRKITRAMEMVSAVKLNRIRASLFRSRPYFFKLESILNFSLTGAGEASHPFLEIRPDNGNIALCVITSDAGLCSIYNHAVIGAAENFLEKFSREKVKLITIGREGYKHFKKRGFNISYSFLELHGRYSESAARSIADNLIGVFSRNEAGAVYIAHTHFDTTLRHKPKITKFLGVEYSKEDGKEYITEPGRKEVLDYIIKLYMAEKMRMILLDSLTSEHSARMLTMRTATDNAEDLLAALELAKNKARQAAITKEVIEIASAAEAVRS